MTAYFIFEFDSGYTRQEIRERLQKHWFGDILDVMKREEEPDHVGGVTCEIGYFAGSDAEKENMLHVISVMAQVMANEVLYYFRCPETVGDTEDYPSEITVEELLSKKYRPNYYDGIQYRYKIDLTDYREP